MLKLSAPTAAVGQTLGVIPDRKEMNGAGPTNIFHLNGPYFAIVDPLRAAVHAYKLEKVNAAVAFASCAIPHDFRAWRTVSRSDAVTLVDELEKQSIDIPRRADFGQPAGSCRLSARSYAPDRDGAPQVIRVSSKEVTLGGARGPLTIRSDREIYSVKELESAGNYRYVLVKQALPASQLPTAADRSPATIGVEVSVVRFNAAGNRVGTVPIPQPGWKKRAFEYATIMPSSAQDDLVRVIYFYHTAAMLTFNFEARVFEAGEPRLARNSNNPPPGRRNWSDIRDLSSVIAATQEIRFTLGIESVAGPLQVPFEPVHRRLQWQTPTPPADIVPRRSGSQIVAAAENFLQLPQSWRVNNSAYKTNSDPSEPGAYQVCSGGKDYKWVEPLQFRAFPSATGYRNMAYSFGGTDDPADFQRKITAGKAAGNIGDIPKDNATSCSGRPNLRFPDDAAGVDCSGLVWHAWGKIGSKAGTVDLWDSQFPGVCNRWLRDVRDLKQGDVIATRGHVVIFSKFINKGPDNASQMLEVIEAASRCSSVCKSRYEFDYFNGWRVFRRQKTDQACPASEADE